MNWQTLIEQSSALDTAVKFNNNTVIPLPTLTAIRVSGEEAASFLQNLLTNDVKQLSQHQAQLSGLCSPKGRLFSIFQLVKQQENDFLIILPVALAPFITQRLTMFKLRSKVEIQLCDADTVAIAGWLAPKTDLSLPEPVGSGLVEGELLFIKQAGQTARLLVIGAPAQLVTWYNQLEQADLAAESSWQLQQILAGMPTITEETKETFTPQQVNLDLIDGVSFKKGCYPGQEVVARMHYLGNPSRRLFLAKLSATTQIASHTEVTDNSGETQGHVVSSASVNNESYALISLKLSAKEAPLQIAQHSIETLQPLADET